MAPRSLAPRWAARLALASLLALAATAGARADDPDAAPAPSPAADETAPPADDAPPEPLSVPPSALTVNARVVPEGKTRRDAQELVLGQPILFEITVSAPRDVELFEPVKPATGSFKLLESQPGTRQTTADALTETYRFRLLPLRVGFEKIPPVEIAYRPRGATAGGSVSTEPLRFHVVGNLENEQDPALAAPPAPVPVIATNWVLVWGLSVGGAIVVAALLTLFVLRALDARFKALAPAPPPRPANEVAIERLDALDGTPDDALDGAARMATTVDILRQYLGGRYGFDALEMTTPELRRELADADLKGIAQTDIDRVLDEADLVKFARIVPSPESARAVAPKVRHVVEVTWEPPKVEVEEEQVPVLEAATQKQRVFAGAIDLGIAGALAILLFALLMVAGALEYGFTAILLVSVLLLFRDAFGRSVGKVVLGLAVVQRRDRQPPATPKQLVVRNLLLVVWPLTLVLEAMVQRRHPLGLRLGDMLAGTEVVQGGPPMTVFGIYLAEPLFLLGLLVLPFLLWRTVSLTGRGRVPVPREASVRALVSVRAALWWVPDGLRMLSVAVLVLALARPQVEGEETVAGEGVDIMLTLDMSGSMNAVDMSRDELEAVLEKDETPANRFLAARETLKQFIVNRSRTSHDRIGLVVFGQNAWLKYPLTLDHARLIHTLNDLVLDDGRRDRDGGSCMNACTIDGGGTAIGDALGRAFNQLRRSTAKSRIVILITDGKQTGSTLDARAIAKHIADLPPDERVRVYTFLVGGTDQVWLPDVDRFGRPLVDRDGHPVYARPRQPFPVDPELLQEIASLTGGKFYESYNEEKFKEDVQDLERTVFTAAVERPHHDRFALLVLVGLLLLAGEWVLRFTFFRSIV